MTKQYIETGKRILSEGEWVHNKRTGENCLTIINVDFVYDVGAGKFPLVTTRKSFWRAAVAELLGYLRGYGNAQEFADLGSPTWFANASNPVWTSNPHYKGEGDIGKAYGVVANDFGGINLFRKVFNNLKQGIDDRGEIVTFWKPDDFDKACLRPCMFQHHFSLLGDTLHLTSYQRSADYPLGTNFNMVQCYVLLLIMAKATGHKPGKVFHKMVNVHVYEPQLELFKAQMERIPHTPPTFELTRELDSWEDVLTLTPDDFKMEGYIHHDAIKYPFTV